jgi:hypothetical protein
MASDAALALVTFLGRNESPPRSIDALKAFHRIAASEAAGLRLGNVRSRERSYLEKIEAVISQSGVLRVRTCVELEFSIPADWY